MTITLPGHRQSPPAFALVVNALRYRSQRGGGSWLCSGLGRGCVLACNLKRVLKIVGPQRLIAFMNA